DPGTGSGRTGGRRSRGAQTTSTQPGGGRAGIGRAGSGRTGGDRQGTGRTKAGLRDVVRTGANSSPDTQRTPRRRVTLGAGGELTEQKGLGEAKQPSPQPEPRQKGQAGKDQAVNKGKKRANQRQGRKGAKGAQNAGRDPGSEAKQGKNRQGQGLRSPQAKAGKHNQGERGGQQASGPRPGHRSSGLRKEQPGEARGHAPTAGTPAASSPRNQGTLPGGSPSATPNRTPNASLSSPSSAPVPPTSARKPRQRSHSAGSSQAGKADES
ncbi:MAG: hypothetical protein LBG81_06435, partial [Coriobacteriaceae bacterium]|nr:hypothetical protein [Coriobacteriaceae bacterium]